MFTNSAEAKKDATITIKTIEKKDRAYVEVHDNGPGMPLNELESFFELPTSTKKGYGLFLCKSIVERHSGEINILESDHGAKIQFWLPIK